MTDSLPTLRKVDVKKNTKLGGRTETNTQHLEEDQNCTFLSVRIKQTKIFVNIKFLVSFFSLFFLRE